MSTIIRMKVLFVATCLMVGVLARSPIHVQEEYEGPVCPVDDPSLKNGPLLINGTAHPFMKVQLGSTLKNMISEGLSTLAWTLNLDILQAEGSIDLKLARATVNGTYSAHGYLDAYPLRRETLPSGNFTGAGFGTFSVTNAEMKANYTLAVNMTENEFKLRTLHIESLHFDAVSIDLGAEFVINGETPPWTELSAHFKDNFDQDWENDRAGVTELIREIFNGFHPYTFVDLVDLITGAVEC